MHHRVGKILLRLTMVMLLVGYLGYSFYVFNEQLSTKVRSQVNEYLRESSVYSVITINNKLDGYMSTTKNIAHVITLLEKPSLSSIHSIIKEASSEFSFARISYTERNGMSYSSDGLQVDLQDREYIQRAFQGELVISDVIVSRYDGNDVFVVAVPVLIDGTIVGVVHSTFLTLNLQLDIPQETFGKDASTYLIKEDGYLISKQAGFGSNQTFTNLFEFMSEQQTMPETILEFQRQLRSGVPGFLSYRVHQQLKYLTFQGVGINDWFLVRFVPNTIVNVQSDFFIAQGLKLTFQVAIALAIVLCYSLFIQWRNSINIQHSKDQLEFINSNIQGGVYKCGVMGSGYFDYMSDGFLNLLGYSRDEIEFNTRNLFMPLVYEKDKSMLRQLRLEAFEKFSREPLTSEYRMNKKDGSVIWVLDKGQFLVDEDGIPWYFSIILDNTQQKMVLDELHYNEQRYRIIAEQSSSIIFDYDYVTKELSISNLFVSMFGYAVNGHNFPESEIGSGHIFPEDAELVRKLFVAPSPENPLKKEEVRILSKNYEFVWCRVITTTVFDESQSPMKAIGRIVNIDDEKRDLEELIRKAKIDELTGLYNKTTSQELIEVILANTFGKMMHAFMVIDIDDFKQVNDTQGHLFGDLVLSDIGQILKGLCKTTDIIGRMGGDEFIILLRDIPSKDYATQKAQEICTHLELYQVFNPDCHRISCSIGITIVPNDATSYTEMFIKADKALYRVKNASKNTYYLYTDMMVVDSYEPVSIEGKRAHQQQGK